ncbi:MAG TPA: hypothetical protein VF984_02590 [Actinomycetota bacterium]
MLRRLFWIALGVAIGYQLATRRTQMENGSSNRTVRLLSERGRSLADRAGAVGLQAVQRARVEIQNRLGGNGDPGWN